MKMKNTAASLALAISSVVAMPAFAAINLDGLQGGGALGGNTFADPAFDPFNYSLGGVGELFVSIVARDASNPTNNRSYVRDLGLSARTFVDARDAGTLGSLAFSFGPDSTLTTFLGDNAGKEVSFLVMAVHNPSGFDPNSFQGRNIGFLTTAGVDAAAVNAAQPQGTAGFQVSGAEVEFRSFVSSVNLKTDGSPVGDVAANLSATFQPGENGFHDLNFGTDQTFLFNTEGKVTGLGGAADFFFLSVDNVDNGISSAPSLLGQWTLSATGDLNFAATAPIPVPAAVWMMSSALVGLAGAARRRRTA